ncbi:MAG: hypothetical protein RBT86_07340 [Azospira sp.]|nr:hypothetical protein [Azospira sp.]
MKRMVSQPCLPFALLLASLPVGAHEVNATVVAAPATVVTLTYADGEPFSFEAFEVRSDASGPPLVVGRTDAAGRAVFLAPVVGEARLRAFSADGHGVDLRLPSPATADAAPVAADERPARILFGLGLLLAVFGLVQLRQKKRGRQ